MKNSGEKKSVRKFETSYEYIYKKKKQKTKNKKKYIGTGDYSLFAKGGTEVRWGNTRRRRRKGRSR